MSRPLEHDYIGFSEVSSMEVSDKMSSASATFTSRGGDGSNVMNLKETELRLGLPGSESPERKGAVAASGVCVLGRGGEDKGVYALGGMKNFVSGAKRGFSDAIDGSGKRGFSGANGSDGDLGKGGVLFSPRGGNGGNGGKLVGGFENNGTQKPGPSPVTKDAVSSPRPAPEKRPQVSAANEHGVGPSTKAQVVGWPPIRSFRKNTMATNPIKNSDDSEGKLGIGCLYVKVSMEGAPYLRKVDLRTYSNYMELSSALEKMFGCFTIGQCGSHGVPGREGFTESRLMDLLHGSEYGLTYEDKDGDWMLVGDVPWEMFTDSCKKLRIMKGSEAIGLAPRAMEKCKNVN